MKAENSNIRDFVNGLDLYKRIDLRDCLVGGRVEVFRSHVEVDTENELQKLPEQRQNIYYQDVQSLYPYVLRTCSYPTDHPIIIPGNKVDLHDMKRYFGIALCRVLPPRGLLIPVLPLRCDGKLLFPLCNKCATNLYQNTCECSDDERSWVQTYTTNELNLAVRHGYKILKVFELLHWEPDQLKTYDPTTKKGGLFTDYINEFIRVKTEASGYPAGCVDDESKTAYVEQYFNTTGVRLNVDDIAMNKGKRALAKSLLNS